MGPGVTEKALLAIAALPDSFARLVTVGAAPDQKFTAPWKSLGLCSHVWTRSTERRI